MFPLPFFNILWPVWVKCECWICRLSFISSEFYWFYSSVLMSWYQYDLSNQQSRNWQYGEITPQLATVEHFPMINSLPFYNFIISTTTHAIHAKLVTVIAVFDSWVRCWKFDSWVAWTNWVPYCGIDRSPNRDNTSYVSYLSSSYYDCVKI